MERIAKDNCGPLGRCESNNILPGAVLSDDLTFKSPSGKSPSGRDIRHDQRQNEIGLGLRAPGLLGHQTTTKKLGFTSVNVTAIIVDFRMVLQNTKFSDIVPGIPNHHLLHAVVGLYGVNLSEMTPDVLYSTVCEEHARTIILLMSQKDAMTEIERYGCKSNQSSETVTSEESCCNSEYLKESRSEIDEQESDYTQDTDVFIAPEESPSIFSELFSDSDDDPEGLSEEEEEEEEFSYGIHGFLKLVKERRRQRRREETPISADNIGIENRIVGAVTYKKTYMKSLERVVHLTLIATRKRYRKYGMGKFLLHQIKDCDVVGQYDAVVVHADNSAIEFFEKYGFTDDIVLNSRWSDLAEQFTNCTLMCHLPPFTESVSDTSIPELDLLAMEKEIKKWREKSIAAYRAELGCVNRMKHEIIYLRALASSQHDTIASLNKDNEQLRREKFILEKKVEDYQQRTTNQYLKFNHTDYEDISTEELIRQLEEEANRRKGPSVAESAQTTCFTQLTETVLCSSKLEQNAELSASEKLLITNHFHEGMKQDSSVVTSYEIQFIKKASMSAATQERIQMKLSKLSTPKTKTRLYYCGSLESPGRLEEILKSGFKEPDFSYGAYGCGLYFSRYPSKAAQFSTFGKLLVVDVGLGCTESQSGKDHTRRSCKKGVDSIVTPGRLKSRDATKEYLCEEYVIFDCHQALPLCIIEYTPVPKDDTFCNDS